MHPSGFPKAWKSRLKHVKTTSHASVTSNLPHLYDIRVRSLSVGLVTPRSQMPVEYRIRNIVLEHPQ